MVNLKNANESCVWMYNKCQDLLLNQFQIYKSSTINHNSFRCEVIGSSYYEKAGPTAKTVFEPALICVCPASYTK